MKCVCCWILGLVALAGVGFAGYHYCCPVAKKACPAPCCPAPVVAPAPKPKLCECCDICKGDCQCVFGKNCGECCCCNKEKACPPKKACCPK